MESHEAGGVSRAEREEGGAVSALRCCVMVARAAAAPRLGKVAVRKPRIPSLCRECAACRGREHCDSRERTCWRGGRAAPARCRKCWFLPVGRRGGASARFHPHRREWPRQPLS
ncbi:hypothetical protein E2C01_098637 [Portunus trituberculatus]|uniref:Uncharacterized protein n=1 Tax=Portunus trituberculatus TaxID=210409 RepID=A0A5B7JYB4_PORTR|nr:hypothetical protein [Portunus trituberculatus]